MLAIQALVNIALIENSIPTLGVVSIPVDDSIYIGGESVGYSKLVNGNQETILEAALKTPLLPCKFF